MTTRREFIKQSALATSLLAYPEALLSKNKLKKIGVQLFSLPKLLDTDFTGTIQLLSKMGYKEVELFGPYPFSSQPAIDSWKGLSARFGFTNGSGYFGKDIKEIKNILDSNGLSAPSAHTDFDTLVEHMDKLGEAAHILGHEYVVLPAIPEDKRKTLDDYKRMAETFNKIGENAKKAGTKFAYHNHGYGFQPIDGQVPIHLLFDQTDPTLVFLEMDVFWTASAGVSPVDYLKKYPNRYRMLHLKDMKEKKTYSGDGNNPKQWLELFPNMTNIGDGVMNVKTIVETGLKTGVKHFFVEQDIVKEPEIALKKSIDFLKK